MSFHRARSLERERNKHHISEKLRNKGWVCRDYLMNSLCPRGTTCPYMHIRNGEVRLTPRHVCAFFKKGVCLRDQCTFFHGTQLQLDALHLQGAETYRPQDFMQVVVPPAEYLNPDGTIKVPDSPSVTPSPCLPPQYQISGATAVTAQIPSTVSPTPQPLLSATASQNISATTGVPTTSQMGQPVLMPSLPGAGPTRIMMDGQQAYRVFLLPPNSSRYSVVYPELSYSNPVYNPSAPLHGFAPMHQQCMTTGSGFLSPFQFQQQVQGLPSAAYITVNPGALPQHLVQVPVAPSNGASIQIQVQNSADSNLRPAGSAPNSFYRYAVQQDPSVKPSQIA